MSSTTSLQFSHFVVKTLNELSIDRVCQVVRYELQKLLTNLQLQVDQRILGPSHRSAHERAGSDSRLRCSFISRYHVESQGRLANEPCFNSLQPLGRWTIYSLTPVLCFASEQLPTGRSAFPTQLCSQQIILW